MNNNYKLKTKTMSYIAKTKVTRTLISQRSWEWYKKEIQRLQELDNKITDRVRATYSIKNKNK